MNNATSYEHLSFTFLLSSHSHSTSHTPLEAPCLVSRHGLHHYSPQVQPWSPIVRAFKGKMRERKCHHRTVLEKENKCFFFFTQECNLQPCPSCYFKVSWQASLFFISRPTVEPIFLFKSKEQKVARSSKMHQEERARKMSNFFSLQCQPVKLSRNSSSSFFPSLREKLIDSHKSLAFVLSQSLA